MSIMAMTITILGANSAIPTANRYPSAQLVDFNHQYYLVDCGECTQIQLRRNKIKMQRIKTIFISHMHGDHYFGIFGLLGTMHLLGRQKPLQLFAPKELEQMIDWELKAAGTVLGYELEFIPTPVNKYEKIFEDNEVEVFTLPLNHRIACNGFLFKEKRGKRRLIKEKLVELNIPLEAYKDLKKGADFIDENGIVHPNEKITKEPRKAWSYAYCSDTRPEPAIIPYIEGVDVLYHEATFLNNEQSRAEKTFHSTAAEAAGFAAEAKAGKLIIGHFSARYTSLDQHLEEARPLFENTVLAIEGERHVFGE